MAACAHQDVDLAARLDADRSRFSAEDAEAHLGFDVERQADAEVSALRARSLLLGAECLVTDELGGLLKRLGRAHRVVLDSARVRERQLGVLDHVASAQFERVDAELLGGNVDQLFAGDGLHHPGAAIGAMTARVRVDALRRVLEALHSVRAGEDECRRRRRHAVAEVRVGADVLEVQCLAGQQRAGVVEGERDVHRLLAGVAAGDQVLGPVLDPLHRPAEQLRRDDDGVVLAAGEHLLPEATADVAHDDPNGVLGHAEQPRPDCSRLVRSLRRRDDLQRRGPRIPGRYEAAWLHRHADVAVLREVLGDHVRGRRRTAAPTAAGRRARARPRSSSRAPGAPVRPASSP